AGADGREALVREAGDGVGEVGAAPLLEDERRRGSKQRLARTREDARGDERLPGAERAAHLVALVERAAPRGLGAAGDRLGGARGAGGRGAVAGTGGAARGAGAGAPRSSSSSITRSRTTPAFSSSSASSRSAAATTALSGFTASTRSHVSRASRFRPMRR